MIRIPQVALWFLLFSFTLSICSCSAPPLFSTHEVNTTRKQKEQITKERESSVDKSGRQGDQDSRHESASSPLTLYYLKWKDGDQGHGSDLSKKAHSLPNPHPHLPNIPMRGREVETKLNINNINMTSNVATPVDVDVTADATATTKTTTATPTTMIHTFFPFPLNYPPSLFSFLKSSSCSSPACKWLASWQFMAVVCMTVAWLVTLMTLYCMTRTTRGKHLLETCLSLCGQGEKYQDEVLTKGIGYFDGSPGLRRFVLIEDEKADEDEDERDDLFTSVPDAARSKEDEEDERGERGGAEKISRKWNPPRRGTYILQEPSKDVLEVGTYRLQEKKEEEEDIGNEGEAGEHGKKREEEKDEEVEYILEGATYILQSEMVGRRVRGIGGEREGYEHVGGIEGLYGIVGRDGPRGGEYGQIKGLGVYGIIGREVGGIGVGRYGRVEGIERLYEILQKGGGGGGGRDREGSGDAGVVLSVRELLGTMGEKGRRKDKVRGERINGGGGGGGSIGGKQGEESGGGRGDEGVEGGSEGEERGKVARGREMSGAKRKQRQRGVSERGRERDGKGGEIHIDDTWGGGTTSKLRGTGEGSWGGRSPSSPKRAASFPMDHFVSSHLMPRKLSLIVEEETH